MRKLSTNSSRREPMSIKACCGLLAGEGSQGSQGSEPQCRRLQELSSSYLVHWQPFQLKSRLDMAKLFAPQLVEERRHGPVGDQ